MQDGLPPGINLKKTLIGHRELIYHISWAPDGNRLATASADGSVAIWLKKSGKRQHHIRLKSGEVFAVSWSPQADLIAAGTEDHVAIIDPESGKVTRTIEDDGIGSAVAWGNHGELLLCGFQSGHIACYGKNETRERWKKPVGRDWVIALATSPTGKECASSTWGTQVIVWNVVKGAEFRRHELPRTAGAGCLNWMPGKTPLLVTGSEDGRIRVWRKAIMRSISIFLDRIEVYKDTPVAIVSFATGESNRISLAEIGNADW